MADYNKPTLLDEKGNISCNKDILSSIISLATKEISGVACLCDGIFGRLSKFFKNTEAKGVKIKFDKNASLLIDVYIKIYNGNTVPDIAYKVQENIKNNISSMVDMKTAKVNVHVMGVMFKTEE